MMAVVAIISSCSNADETTPIIPVEEQISYTVSLNPTGDYTNVTEEQLSRADSPTKYYGINVYCMKTDGSESGYSFYAYGIFDNTDNMTISLLGGYKYRFVCASYEEGEDQIYIDSGTNRFGDYPFKSKKCENQFTYTTKDYSLGIDDTCVTTAKVFNRYSDPTKYSAAPQMTMMYGMVSDFVPADNSTVIIPMIRIGYGIKVVVACIPDGNLKVSVFDLGFGAYSNGWSKDFTEAGEAETVVADGIYSAITYTDWEERVKSYTTANTINFYWTRANGYVQEFSQNVTFKNNVKTVVTVNLTGGAGDVSIGIEEDNASITDEDVTVNYDGGNISDTPLDPQ